VTLLIMDYLPQGLLLPDPRFHMISYPDRDNATKLRAACLAEEMGAGCFSMYLTVKCRALIHNR
jgi:hypothetical protein